MLKKYLKKLHKRLNKQRMPEKTVVKRAASSAPEKLARTPSEEKLGIDASIS